jgi:hypothetical protein
MMKWIVIAVGFSMISAAPACAQDRSAVVQAVCMDARGLPHPAAQTFAARDVAADYEGELFRCLPGAAMRYVVDSYSHDCAAGEALWFGEGALSCRAATEHPREHDRDLLRQFRAGVKLVPLAPAAPPQQRTDQPRPTYPRYN